MTESVKSFFFLFFFELPSARVYSGCFVVNQGPDLFLNLPGNHVRRIEYRTALNPSGIHGVLLRVNQYINQGRAVLRLCHAHSQSRLGAAAASIHSPPRHISSTESSKLANPLFFPRPAGTGSLSLNAPTIATSSQRTPPQNFAAVRTAARETRTRNAATSFLLPSKGKEKDLSGMSIAALLEMKERNDQLLDSPCVFFWFLSLSSSELASDLLCSATIGTYWQL